ncbi:hypothetical protein [Verrucomicrobium spinosum]|uniref:hypothetical protein n=1 Tax=Verrucomicrobium spinosum TaxID=2736 RepID=UPI000AA468E0|nr:hypothetical protein [Verrucomicrobium spinosum]
MAATQFHQVLGGGEASAAVVDAHQIVSAAFGVGQKVAVQQYYGDASLIQGSDDAVVRLVLIVGGFQRSEEDAAHPAAR